MKNYFFVSMGLTLLINLLAILFSIFGGVSDMCNPSIGIIFGIYIFAPITGLTFLISGIIALVKKNKIAKGIAVAEIITIIFAFAMFFRLI